MRRGPLPWSPMRSTRRMLTMPTKKPPNAMPTITLMDSGEPHLSSLSSSPEVDEPGMVGPVLVGPKVSNEADLLVAGKALELLSDEPMNPWRMLKVVYPKSLWSF